MARTRQWFFLSLLFSAFLLATEEGGASDCPSIFHSPRSFDTEREPYGIVPADLNDDGFIDLAVSNHGNREVSVLLADPSEPGSFLSTSYRVWGGPLDLAVADFNHDNIFDIAVACESTGTVSILLGNGTAGVGDGTFPPRSDYMAGGGASSVSADDFDADGDMDLVVACASIDSAAFLKGNGDGTFQSPVRYKVGSAGAAPMDIFSFHANADTLLDIVLSCSGEDSVAVLDGLGGGAFAAPRKYASGQEPWGIIGGDFDGDGIADLATANRLSGDLSVFIGNGVGSVGDGTFQTAVSYPAGNGAWQIASGDVSNDGVDDLVVSCANADLVLRLAGNGDGTFAAAESLDAGDLPAGLAVADLNDDLLPDLAVLSRYSDDVSILAAMPTGDGTLIIKSDYEVIRGPQAIVAGDFNEDGILDLIAGASLQRQVTVLLGSGADSTWDGNFLDTTMYAAGNYSTSIASADFNGDGILDLVTSNRFGRSMTILIGNGTGGMGDGSFQAPAFYPAGDENRHAVPADFNGDGILDIFVAGFFSQDISMYMGNGIAGEGDGTFSLLGSLTPGDGPQYIAVSDFNEDGILDLAIALSPVDHVAVMIAGGTAGVWDSTFASPVNYAIGDYPTCVAAVDLDGDGILDLVTVDQVSDQISVLLGNGAGGVGDGTFASAVAYATGTGPRRVALADYNGDGILDAATGNRHSNDFSVLAGVGDGSFNAEERFDAGNQPWGIIATDLNRDGAPDLAITNWDGNDVSVILNGSCLVTEVNAPGPRPFVFAPFSRPNPFNPSTTIHFVLDEPGEVAVDLYDVRGRLVRNLLHDFRRPGRHEVMWDGIGRAGNRSASGLYLFRIRNGERISTGKMILVR